MARPKVILNLYPMFPADSFEERIAKRPLGTNRELYTRIVHEWIEIVQAAERMGLWGCSTIEHHFHSEGYEISPNPGILNAFWAGQTKTINIGALGYVAGTWDPIRLAEETAIMDHLLKGRYWVGFARGYQARWANVLGQHTGAVATVSDKSADDIQNRKVFEERVDMVLKCWTEDAVKLDHDTYKAPFPATGVEGYPAWRTSMAAGAEGETDGNGRITKICVVPKPYQRPHPPVMVPTTKSIESIEFCARRGFIPVHFSPVQQAHDAINVYQELSAKHGHAVKFGQKQNICRFPHVGKSAADWDRKLKLYDVDIYKNFYGPFFPQMPQGDGDALLAGMKKSELFVGGSLQECKDTWRHIYEKAPCEYITLIWHWAQCPKEVLLEELDLFMREVLPELETPDYEVRKAAAE
jgi:alkanesulfonate monooxygenase SsuD/methylene tetrahydromethanopterin reductase-like flavin-dependent oxidoreductase (luciferase family)